MKPAVRAWPWSRPLRHLEVRQALQSGRRTGKPGISAVMSWTVWKPGNGELALAARRAASFESECPKLHRCLLSEVRKQLQQPLKRTSESKERWRRGLSGAQAGSGKPDDPMSERLLSERRWMRWTSG